MAPLDSKSKFRLLILATILHVAVTTTVFIAGNRGLVPSQFSSNGLAAFASDGFLYQNEVVQLPDVLKHQGIRAWSTWPTQLHIRIYSLPLVVLYRFFGFNILTIEPVNLIYYLSILALVFKLGETILNYRAGIIAATVVGLWPSLLLHTTQLLRDPLLIAMFLLFMLSLEHFLEFGNSWRRDVSWGVIAAVAVVIIRIVRLPMWDVLWAILALAICLLLIGLIKIRKIQVGKIAFVSLILGTMIFIPHFQSAFRNQQTVKSPRVLNPEEVQRLSVPEQIIRRREAFGLQANQEGGVTPSEAGSDLNNDVHFATKADMIRYLPRAAAVGFLAPFPNMWFSPGKQVGASGRLLSGFEMILTYFILTLSLIGLWSRRKDLSSWFLFLSASLGILALGLVVTNIGALYRVRYPFWMLMVILAAGGALHLYELMRNRGTLLKARVDAVPLPI